MARVGSPLTPGPAADPNAQAASGAQAGQEAQAVDENGVPIAGDPISQLPPEVGLDFNALSDDERGFADAFMRGELDTPMAPADRTIDNGASLPPAAAPTNPLAPSDAPAGTPGTTPGTPAGATTDDASGDGITTGIAASSGGGESVGPHGTPPAATSPPPTGAPAGVSGGEPPVAFMEVDGQQVPVDLLRYGLDLAKGVTPAEIELLNRMRQGQASATFTDPATGLPPGTQPGVPAPAAISDEEWLDPRAQAEVTRLNGELAQYRQEQAQIAAAQAQQQASALDRIANDTAETYQQARQLDDAAMSRLVQTGTAMGIFATMSQQYPNDPATAVQQGLELTYWNIPEFRDREINAAVSRHMTETQDARTRAANAAQLTPSGGSVTRTAPAPSTPDERQRAMVADIANAMQNGDGSEQ